ncbi:MAG: cell wall hydrolase [Bacillota bacterium]
MTRYKLQLTVGLIMMLLLTSSGIAFGSVNHTVQSGESLWKIARQYQTTVNQIKKANNHWSNLIVPGQQLQIPDNLQNNRSHNQNLDLLARLVRAEARGESFKGKVGVAAVVINRVQNDEFPDTISNVIYQPLAFEPVNNGKINQPADQESIKAAQAALNGWDPTRNSLFFYNPAKIYSPYNWIWNRTTVTRIDNHIFAL